MQLFGSFHAEFVSRVDGQFIRVVDIGHNHTRSVTNDAEWVVEELAKLHVSKLAEKYVLYQDSDGRWDYLVVKSGVFHGFLTGHATRAMVAEAYGFEPPIPTLGFIQRIQPGETELPPWQQPQPERTAL